MYKVLFFLFALPLILGCNKDSDVLVEFSHVSSINAQSPVGTWYQYDTECAPYNIDTLFVNISDICIRSQFVDSLCIPYITKIDTIQFQPAPSDTLLLNWANYDLTFDTDTLWWINPTSDGNLSDCMTEFRRL